MTFSKTGPAVAMRDGRKKDTAQTEMLSSGNG